ncbi:UMP-CMP kinase 2, mitochondrial [Dendroctonus ponderosae]|nr:UMP-CMP kinase 2, mitochondrial [Dendroctonus ponderosae]
MNSSADFGLFKDSREILQYLSKYEDLEPVRKLLKIYDETKTRADERRKEAQFPLIVLEGLDGAGKTAMSKKLSKKLEGARYVTPPESTNLLRDYFNDNSELRTAYYSLGNYIAAMEVSCTLQEKPVVMDRFWHSTTAYAIAQKIADHPERYKLPDATDEIYQWPVDLLKPQKVILLTVSEEIRLERHSRRSADLVTEQEHLLKANAKFREDILQAFKNMRNPNVAIVDSNGSFGKTFYMLLDTAKPLLRK